MKHAFMYTMRIMVDGQKYFRWGYTIDRLRTFNDYMRDYRDYNLKPKWEPTSRNTALIRRSMVSYLKPSTYKAVKFMNHIWYPIQPRLIRRAMKKVRKNQF